MKYKCFICEDGNALVTGLVCGSCGKEGKDSTVEHFLAGQIKGKRRRPFVAHASLSKDGMMIQIFLEDCAYVAEWIKGEGADICIHRSMQGNRVVGATLPLFKWAGKFPVYVD